MTFKEKISKTMADGGPFFRIDGAGDKPIVAEVVEVGDDYLVIPNGAVERIIPIEAIQSIESVLDPDKHTYVYRKK